MSRTWSFTDLEFVVLWERLEEDFLPHPLMFTSRIRLHDDLAREKAQIWDRLRSTVDGSLGDALAAIARPDVRLAVQGRNGKDLDDPAGSIRILATRSGDSGYVVKQRPGETIRHSAGFTITECSAVRLADAVVAELPDIGPGKLADITLVPERSADDMDYSYGRSRVEQATFENSVGQRSQRFLESSLSVIGAIEIIQGRSRFGPRGVTRHVLQWRDVEGDGRYVIAVQNPLAAVAADRKRLTAMINTKIAEVVRVIKDEGGV
ncbi:ESX secretion-associated protein EspG [Nocardia sp. NBC_00881]|uniref:ESX secretion-associated protein EspG n=1 Tax=Nocardia sp. NBC_00881 TaxID=2975995 RepID=UPI00386F2D82|nr:ESX secretion-associated protein EspG [Nocardia sp. NBC_00881]